MFFILLLGILGATAAVEEYRIKTYSHGVQRVKDVTVSESDQYAVIRVSSGERPIKTEYHDFTTGYAAYKANGNCLISKTPFAITDVKNSLVAQIKDDPSLGPSPLGVDEESKEKDKDKVASLVGPRIADFCGDLNIVKVTLKRTRTRRPGQKPIKKCLFLCVRVRVRIGKR